MDVANRQALAIEEVDFIYQAYNESTGVYGSFFQAAYLTNDASLDIQLTDLNRGLIIVGADDTALVASGSMLIDGTNNISSMQPDVYPD